MLLTIVILIGVLIIAYLLIVNYYPSFGGDVSKERQKQYLVSKNYLDGKFKNKKDVPKDLSAGETISIAYTVFTTKVPNDKPKNDLEVQKLDSVEVANYNGPTRLIWYGHSSFLLQTDGMNILIDPMFDQVPSPLSWLGNKRFNSAMPLEIEKLPQIDAVIISHDHYDHLDYKSILKLKFKVDHFFVPLGVGVHLEAWGVDTAIIKELDWWQEINYKGLKLAATPAQHFSGRKFDNRQSTLWCSWVIKSSTDNIFFSGDSGYGDHFKKIGETYGPFDFAMLECGQYNEMWADIHMMPEETVLAGIDVKAKKIMPIHWAGFKLALHSWTDPILRVSAKANALNVPLVTPKIGQAIVVKDSLEVYEKWWENL